MCSTRGASQGMYNTFVSTMWHIRQNPIWLGNPEETSPEIQNRGTSGPKIGHVNVSHFRKYNLKPTSGSTTSKPTSGSSTSNPLPEVQPQTHFRKEQPQTHFRKCNLKPHFRKYNLKPTSGSTTSRPTSAGY